MIVFDLKCDHEHVFEAWFSSSAAFEEQRDAGLVECPYCGSSAVSKAIMAPNVGAKSNQKTTQSTAHHPISDAPIDGGQVAPPMSSPASPSTPSQASTQALPADLQEAAVKFFDGMRKHVQENCDYVGSEFVEEARKIHYGEADERGIYGEATADETAELLDEGIAVLPVPGMRRTDS